MDAGSVTRTMTLALKEWGAVVHALLDGRQAILLRKGGIHERAFGVEGARFVLFPTVEHSYRERVRSEHADLLTRGAADVAGERFVVRCGITLVDVVRTSRPEALTELADLHVYTDEHVAERLAFRPRHPLHVLVARAVALPAPVTLIRQETYGGCRSWLELPIAWDGLAGSPVLTDGELATIAQRVRSTLSVT